MQSRGQEDHAHIAYTKTKTKTSLKKQNKKYFLKIQDIILISPLRTYFCDFALISLLMRTHLFVLKSYYLRMLCGMFR